MATSRDAISAAGKGDGIFFASDQQVSQVRLSEMGTFYVWNAAKKRRFLKKSWHTTYKDFNHLFIRLQISLLVCKEFFMGEKFSCPVGQIFPHCN